MKARIFILIILTTFLWQGCIVKSLHPFFEESNVVFKPELIDSWVDHDGNKWDILGVKEKANAYEMRYEKDGKSAVFIVHLFELDEQLYVDFFPTGSDADIPIFDLHLLPTHSIAKIEKMNASEIHIKWFNAEWLSTLFKQNRIKISHEVIMDETPQNEDDKMYVLTASTEELQKFILKYGHEDSAFDGDNTVRLVLKRSI